MEQLNTTLFLMLNATLPANPAAVALATFAAQYLIWLLPIVLVAAWLRGSEDLRRAAFRAALAAVIACAVSYLIGVLWRHPRPFALGIGTRLLPHVPDSSFPSDHLSLWWSIGFSLLMPPRSRAGLRAGLVLTLLGLPVAWARIYLGLHFPFDMVGAALTALIAASGVALCEGRAFDALFRVSVQLYRLAFAPLIRLGLAVR